MRIIIYTTNNYPKYERYEIIVNNGIAKERFEEYKKLLCKQLRNGEIQDYQIELTF